MLRPYIIGVLSQKGGVGKTTVAVNLAVALKLTNKRVLMVDADTDNPAVGLHLGMEDAKVGFENLVVDGASLANVVTVHAPTGMHCVLGMLSTKPFQLTNTHVKRLVEELERCSYDFVVVDTAPGLQQEEDMMPFDEAVIVATPDLPALTSALRLGEELKGIKERYTLTLNRVTGRSYELRISEIEDAWGGKVTVAFPEDTTVSESLAAHTPAYLSGESSPFTVAMKKLANACAGKAGGASQHGPQFANWKRLSGERERKESEKISKIAAEALKKEEKRQRALLAEKIEKERAEAESKAKREIESMRKKMEAKAKAEELARKAEMKRKIEARKQVELRKEQAKELRKSAKELKTKGKNKAKKRSKLKKAAARKSQKNNRSKGAAVKRPKNEAADDGNKSLNKIAKARADSLAWGLSPISEPAEEKEKDEDEDDAEAGGASQDTNEASPSPEEGGEEPGGSSEVET
ncbi:MAG: AAA family ATPase [Candidatus Micrarchaeota archaeon]|nr:AAA family ATPase [Candidatus Micrarchaeota archaeon]